MLAVQPGRAFASLLGFILSMAFGLMYVVALQVRFPGWFVPYLWPSLLTSVAHAGWALWEAFQRGGRIGSATVFGHNGVGTLMLLGVILGAVWLVSQRDWRRSLVIPYGTWVGAALVMTYSRGSWLGLLAFAVVATVPAWKQPMARRYAVVLLAAGVLLLSLMITSIPGAAQRATTFVGLGDDPRVGVYQAAWHMFLDHPWLGVGPSNFDNFWETYNQGRVRYAVGFPHNTILQVLTETGVVGGLFFGLIVARLLAAVWRQRNTTDWPLWLLAAGFLAMLVRDQVDGAIFNINIAFVFWWIGGIVLGAEVARSQRHLSETVAVSS